MNNQNEFFKFYVHFLLWACQDVMEKICKENNFQNAAIIKTDLEKKNK